MSQPIASWQVISAQFKCNCCSQRNGCTRLLIELFSWPACLYFVQKDKKKNLYKWINKRTTTTKKKKNGRFFPPFFFSRYANAFWVAAIDVTGPFPFDGPTNSSYYNRSRTQQQEIIIFIFFSSFRIKDRNIFMFKDRKWNEINEEKQNKKEEKEITKKDARNRCHSLADNNRRQLRLLSICYRHRCTLDNSIHRSTKSLLLLISSAMTPECSCWCTRFDTPDLERCNQSRRVPARSWWNLLEMSIDLDSIAPIYCTLYQARLCLDRIWCIGWCLSIFEWNDCQILQPSSHPPARQQRRQKFDPRFATGSEQFN